MNRIYSLSLLCLAFVSSAFATNPNSTKPQPGTQKASGFLVELGKGIHQTSLDCSHFVHALYEKAGFHYPYATAHNLYVGFRGFRRVSQPEVGDLVVWPGHVGIVWEPKGHKFFSACHKVVKWSSYVSNYWAKKGQVHFFRYAKAGSPPNDQPAMETAANTTVPAE